MNRRNFIGSMLAAPSIVRAEILMPVTKVWTPRILHDWHAAELAGRNLFVSGIQPYHIARRDAINRLNERYYGIIEQPR